MPTPVQGWVEASHLVNAVINHGKSLAYANVCIEQIAFLFPVSVEETFLFQDFQRRWEALRRLVALPLIT